MRLRFAAEFEITSSHFLKGLCRVLLRLAGWLRTCPRRETEPFVLECSRGSGTRPLRRRPLAQGRCRAFSWALFRIVFPVTLKEARVATLSFVGVAVVGFLLLFFSALVCLLITSGASTGSKYGW